MCWVLLWAWACRRHSWGRALRREPMESVVARLSEVALSSKLAGERGVSVVRLEVALSNELGGKRGLSDEVLWQAWGVETWLISL
ncbi:hypothetical protein HN873_004854, partial [Arachis hypogaea]